MSAQQTYRESVMRELWPHLFTVPVPLKIGIHKDIAPLLPESFSYRQMCKFLYHWVHSEGYRFQLFNSKFRYDLNGNASPIGDQWGNP